MQASRLLAVLVWFSGTVFAVGMGWRFFVWLRARVPLKVVLTPGPVTTAGVFRRLAGEALLFRSLFKADPALWSAAWLFHLSLLLLAAGHIGGLVIPGHVRSWLGISETQFHSLAQISGGLFGLLAGISLIWLLLRRVAIERLRYFSTLGDYTALGLLLLVVFTGNQMRFFSGLEMEQAHDFVAAVLAFHMRPAPPEPVFTVHLVLVCALLIYIPFSKLVHLGGLVFSPTINQKNDPRLRRHMGPCAVLRGP